MGQFAWPNDPWNQAWKLSPHVDAYVVRVDDKTGHSWEIWGHPEFRNDTICSGATKIIQQDVAHPL